LFKMSFYRLMRLEIPASTSKARRICRPRGLSPRVAMAGLSVQKRLAAAVSARLGNLVRRAASGLKFCQTQSLVCDVPCSCVMNHVFVECGTTQREAHRASEALPALDLQHTRVGWLLGPDSFDGLLLATI